MENLGDAIDRRKFLKLGASAVGGALIATATGNRSNATEPQKNPSAISRVEPNLSPDAALSLLLDGNKRFVEQKYVNPNQDVPRIVEVSKNQSPFACVLSCSDSRVSPEIVFDRGLGDLFVVRDAGNVATPGEIGSLEYGTLVLGAKIILVLGHENCTAIQTALRGVSLPGSFGNIVEAVLPAVKSVEKERGNAIENAVKANIFLQKERVKNSPIIARLIREQKLKVVGAYYDLNTGRVSLLS